MNYIPWSWPLLVTLWLPPWSLSLTWTVEAIASIRSSILSPCLFSAQLPACWFEHTCQVWLLCSASTGAPHLPHVIVPKRPPVICVPTRISKLYPSLSHHMPFLWQARCGFVLGTFASPLPGTRFSRPPFCHLLQVLHSDVTLSMRAALATMEDPFLLRHPPAPQSPLTGSSFLFSMECIPSYHTMLFIVCVVSFLSLCLTM